MDKKINVEKEYGIGAFSVFGVYSLIHNNNIFPIEAQFSYIILSINIDN
jgi:hypothetical protein